ncbi:RluA family pseudouridine synthase [Portibacter marinus]|uniref:RluA family pseudouridine synthase n=1 Tax=Portibacter marinus TaxID=2898660 RepID=UPI001F1B1DC8|nr:RluA family pseudouridine synthase [Portibacter marinus]
MDEDMDDELYEHYNIITDPGQRPIRIDKFLMDRIEKTSRNQIQNAIKSGQILVNGDVVKSNYKIRPHEHIQVYLDKPLEAFEIIPEEIPLDIRYEDEYLMVIYKEPGMVVHPGVGNKSGTLVNALAHHFQQKLPVMEGNLPDRPGLVHRIDKDTSGLLVIAKTARAMTGLAKQFFDHSIERKYQAIVWGNFDHKKGTIEGHIGRHPRDRKLMTVFPDGDFGKDAITHYKVLEDLYYVSLVECQLETGRTHQIRAHMKYMHHPLFGDARYGGDKVVKGTVFSKYKAFVNNCLEVCPRQALHARSLGFIHPISNEEMKFEAPLPDDMKELLERWRNYVAHRKEIDHGK